MNIYLVNRIDAPTIIMGAFSTEEGALEVALDHRALQVVTYQVDASEEFFPVFVIIEDDQIKQVTSSGLVAERAKEFKIIDVAPARRRRIELTAHTGYISYFEKGDDRTKVLDPVQVTRRICPGEEELIFPRAFRLYADKGLPHRVEFFCTSERQLNLLLDKYKVFSDRELNLLFKVGVETSLVKGKDGEWSIFKNWRTNA